VHLDDILYVGDGIAYYLDYIIFNLVASTIPKWRMFKLLRCMLHLNRLVDLDEILCGGYDIEDDIDSILLSLAA
jgi:hypothetical protein